MTQSALSWFLIGLTGSHIRAFPKAAALDSKITQLISFPSTTALASLAEYLGLHTALHLSKRSYHLDQSKPCIAMLSYCAGINTKQLPL